MAVSPDYLEHLLDQFAAFGPVDARRMFGGVGIYRNGLMFALVTDDTLYFKTDDTNRAAFEAAGMAPFSFTSRGKRMITSYFEAPAEVFDDPEALVRWARNAHEAALRVNRAKRSKAKPKPKSKPKPGRLASAGRRRTGAARAKARPAPRRRR